MEDNKKVERINKLIRKWNDYAGDSIDRSMHIRKLVYDSNYAKDKIGSLGGADDSVKSVINLVRSAVNRIKTDFRDFHPYYELKPTSNFHSSEERVQMQSALNEKVSKSINELYGSFDDVLDLSLCAVKVDVKYDDSGKPDLYIDRIHDLSMIYGDCSVSIDKAFKDGTYSGVIRKIDYESNRHLFDRLDRSATNSDDIVLIEHFEKVVKKREKMGVRYDPETGKLVTEKVWKWRKGEDGERINGPTYIRTFEKSEMKIKLTRIADDVLQSEEYLDIDYFPIVIGAGVFIDSNDSREKDRLTLVPYADSVIDAQQSLNMAASLNMKYMMQSRGSTKLMYTPEIVAGWEDIYKNRNISESDVVYNYTIGPNGEKLDIPPKPFPDITPSPVVSEALQNYPSLTQQILGVNLEQDTLFNKSGEAIKQMQVVRHKSAKLYIDCYLQFMRNVGEVIKELFVNYFTSPMSIYTNYDGEKATINLNEMNEVGSIINDVSSMKDKYEFVMEIGPSPAVAREKTNASLMMLYQAMGPELGQQLALKTSAMYAASLDTQNRDLIVKAVKELQQESAQNQQMQAVQMQQNYQNQMEMQKQALAAKEQEIRIENEKHAAELADVHAKLVKSQTEIVKVHKELEMAIEELRIEKLKANAEVKTASINAGVAIAKIMKESAYE